MRIYSSNFRESIGKISDLFWDRPMSAIDTAIFWIEYTARHGIVLKSPATDLCCWKYHLLDVYGFLLLCISVVIYAFVKLIKVLLRCGRKSPPKKVSKAKKNK